MSVSEQANKLRMVENKLSIGHNMAISDVVGKRKEKNGKRMERKTKDRGLYEEEAGCIQ